LNPLSTVNAEACFRIAQDNERLDRDIQRFVLPYDSQLNSTYIRFSLPDSMPFFESFNNDYVLHKVQEWLKQPLSATKCARAAKSLAADSFPNTPEDCLAISSLAGLLLAALRQGYSFEAGILSEVICNFLLYEAASGEGGSFRKVLLASTLGRVTERLNELYEAYDMEQTVPFKSEDGVKVAVSAGVLGLSGEATDTVFVPSKLTNPSEIVNGCYSFLISINQKQSAEDWYHSFQIILQDLASLVGSHPEPNHFFITRVETLLKLATLATLCQACTVEALRGVKGLLHNGTTLGHMYAILNDEPLDGFSGELLIPVAGAIATSISLGNWSPFRDNAIINLFATVSAKTCDWAFVNLAIERLRLSEETIGGEDLLQVTTVCRTILRSRSLEFERSRVEIAALSVRNGYLGLLEQCLESELLSVPASPAIRGAPPDLVKILEFSSDSNRDSILHVSCKLGYPHVTQLIARILGERLASDFLNRPNHQGHTALHLACKYRASEEVLWLLFVNNARLSDQCNLGRTPLHYCFPDQALLPEIHSLILELAKEYALPTIEPLQKPKLYRQGELLHETDPRVLSFERIASRLCKLMNDPATQDDDGMTALSLAASRGWAHLLDVFLDDDGSSQSEYMQHTLLGLRDRHGRTALDHARQAGSQGVIRGGEDIIAAEMTKRGMNIPPKKEGPRDLGFVEVRRSPAHQPQKSAEDVLLPHGLWEGKPAAGPSQGGEAGAPFFPYLETLNQPEDSPNHREEQYLRSNAHEYSANSPSSNNRIPVVAVNVGNYPNPRTPSPPAARAHLDSHHIGNASASSYTSTSPASGRSYSRSPTVPSAQLHRPPEHPPSSQNALLYANPRVQSPQQPHMMFEVDRSPSPAVEPRLHVSPQYVPARDKAPSPSKFLRRFRKES
jgi:ankyrin repeat protein